MFRLGLIVIASKLSFRLSWRTQLPQHALNSAILFCFAGSIGNEKFAILNVIAFCFNGSFVQNYFSGFSSSYTVSCMKARRTFIFICALVYWISVLFLNTKSTCSPHVSTRIYNTAIELNPCTGCLSTLSSSFSICEFRQQHEKKNKVNKQHPCRFNSSVPVKNETKTRERRKKRRNYSLLRFIRLAYCILFNKLFTLWIVIICDEDLFCGNSDTFWICSLDLIISIHTRNEFLKSRSFWQCLGGRMEIMSNYPLRRRDSEKICVVLFTDASDVTLIVQENIMQFLFQQLLHFDKNIQLTITRLHLYECIQLWSQIYPECSASNKLSFTTISICIYKPATICTLYTVHKNTE